MLDMSPSRRELRGNVMTRLTILPNILFPKPRDYRQNGKFTIYFIYEPGVDSSNRPQGELSISIQMSEDKQLASGFTDCQNLADKWKTAMTLTSSDLSHIGTPENDICCKSLSLYMRHVFSINIGTGTTGFSLYMIVKFG